VTISQDREITSPEGYQGERSTNTVNTCSSEKYHAHSKNNKKSRSYRVEIVQESRKKKRKQKKKKNKQHFRTFGDHLVDKEDHLCRIVSQNVDCIGVVSKDNYKQEKAKDWLIQHEVDVVGWQETGIAFHRLPKQDRLAERMRDPRWAKTRISSCNNKHENVDNFQYGGTSVMAFNEVAHRVHTTGGDDTGLGRWSWILFEGKSKYRTRIISAYVPCRTSDTHRQTVYMQHKRYFMKRGISECPRKLLHSHLSNQIQNWQNNGENIVLLIRA